MSSRRDGLAASTALVQCLDGVRARNGARSAKGAALRLEPLASVLLAASTVCVDASAGADFEV
jgi:hypothetical protein